MDTAYQVQSGLSANNAHRPERAPTNDPTSPGGWPRRDRTDERRAILRYSSALASVRREGSLTKNQNALVDQRGRPLLRAEEVGQSGSRRLNRIQTMVGTMKVTAPVGMAINGPVASRTARNTNTVINKIAS